MVKPCSFTLNYHSKLFFLRFRGPRIGIYNAHGCATDTLQALFSFRGQAGLTAAVQAPGSEEIERRRVFTWCGAAVVFLGYIYVYILRKCRRSVKPCARMSSKAYNLCNEASLWIYIRAYIYIYTKRPYQTEALAHSLHSHSIYTPYRTSAPFKLIFQLISTPSASARVRDICHFE